MPWTPAQNRLFRAAANNPKIARSSGISQNKAKELLGHDKDNKRKALAKELMKGK